MDRICKRLTILVLSGLTIGGVSSSIVLANTKPVETKAVEAEQSNATKTEDATKIYIEDQIGWNFRTLGLYGLTFENGHTYTEFESFLTSYYGPEVTSGYDRESTTRSWAKRSGKTNEYYICAGGTESGHSFEFPWWISASAYAANNGNNDTGINFVYHHDNKSYIYNDGGKKVSNVDDGATTFAFEAVNISKIAVDADTKTQIQGPEIPDDQTVIYNRYPNSGDVPADPITLEKYTFEGWYMDMTLTQPFVKQVYSTNTTIYAKYNLKSYTVQFDAGGGTGSVESITSKLGTAITLPDPTDKFVPPASHCTFDCWVDSNGTEYAVGASFNSDDAGTYTMTAKWKTSAQVSVNGGKAINMTWDSTNKQAKLENKALQSGDLITFIVSEISITYTDGTGTNLYNHRIKKPGSSLGLYLKENDGSFTAYASGLDGEVEYSRELVINNKFVETIPDGSVISELTQHFLLDLNLSVNDSIKLSYKYGNPYDVEYLITSFGTTGKFELVDGALICKEANSYDFYLKKTSGSDWTTVYIQYHDMESEALAYADYFLNKLSPICKEDGSTDIDELQDAWSQEGDTSLSDKFSSLLADAQKYLREFSSETPAKIAACINKYDFIMTKYNATYSETITNFMGRTVKSPQPIGPQPINPNSKVNGFIILASVIGASTLLATGVFVAKKTSKNKKKTHK